MRNVPEAQKSFWTHSMVPLDEEVQVEARFSPFGHSANVYARSVHSLRRAYHRLRNHFRRTRWNSSVTWVMWDLVFISLEIVLASVQDRCSVCVKRTIGTEIVLDAPDATPCL